MKYYKNTELAKLYHVSEKSVRNWIQAALEEKLDLELHESNGKHFVSNTIKNTTEIKNLVEKGKKYKNTRGFRVCRPKKEFYKFYDTKQILDIISNLNVHREIPVQYSYVDGGAEYWDKYVTKLSSESSENILSATQDMLDSASHIIEKTINNDTKVNVFDLGPGNAMPIKGVLEKLIKQDRLGKYVAIDNSKEMLQIAERNLRKWFGSDFPLEVHIRDISYERFNDLLIEHSSDDQQVVNFIYLLGGTISNFRAPTQVIENINNSMGETDILFSSGYLDTPDTRRFFDFEVSDTELYKGELILEMMNIGRDLFKLEFNFIEDKIAREISMRMIKDVKIEFQLPNATKTTELSKNDRVLLWRYWHRGVIDIINFYDKNGFELVSSLKSKNKNYFLLTSQVKLSVNQFP